MEKWSITEEKRFNLSKLGSEFSKFFHQSTIRDWLPLADIPAAYFKELVLKFYASYQSTQDAMNLKGPIDEYLNFPSIKVCGVDIDVTLVSINSLFRHKPIEDGDEFTRRASTKQNQLQWVAGFIAMVYPNWASMGGDISRQDFNFKEKLWMDFICTRIRPSKNDQGVTHDETILIACLISGIHLKYGEIVATKMRRKSHQTTFQCLSPC